MTNLQSLILCVILSLDLVTSIAIGRRVENLIFLILVKNRFVTSVIQFIKGARQSTAHFLSVIIIMFSFFCGGAFVGKHSTLTQMHEMTVYGVNPDNTLHNIKCDSIDEWTGRLPIPLADAQPGRYHLISLSSMESCMMDKTASFKLTFNAVSAPYPRGNQGRILTRVRLVILTQREAISRFESGDVIDVFENTSRRLIVLHKMILPKNIVETIVEDSIPST